MTGQIERVQALIGGEWVTDGAIFEVRNPYLNEVVATAPDNTEADCDRALAAAEGAKAAMAAWAPRERAAYLRRVADAIDVRREEIANAMSRETGKAIKDSRFEVLRSADTLRLCAEEAVRIEGAHIPLDATALGSGKISMSLRFPVGVVSAITPFNAPVNIVMHKIGSAIAAGNASLLKPSPKAPLSVHKAMACFVEAGGLPAGGVNIIYGDRVGPMMVSDPRANFVTFTGSTKVGKIIRNAVGMKRVALELGGVGPNVVHKDADIAAAATACARNGLLLAGQSCISVQNIYVHKSVVEVFTQTLLEEVAKVRFGDPMDDATDVGTLIDETAAIRVAGMIERARAEGAEIIAGGGRRGAQHEGTVLFNVRDNMEIALEEIFGPAMSILIYDDITEVFRTITNSPVGLQCGVFTGSLAIAVQAIKTIHTGGVIINGPSRWRSDQMPYGGVKDSGMGREGPKFAIRDMTDERVFVLN